MTAKIDYLDGLWKPFIRSVGYCECCGGKNTLTDSHVLKCGYLKTRWDPRNNQCLGWYCCHAPFEGQPTAFTRWVEESSCGPYMDTMLVQANALAKPDFNLWKKLFHIIDKRGYTVEESRLWLGDTILLSEYDLLKLG